MATYASYRLDSRDERWGVMLPVVLRSDRRDSIAPHRNAQVIILM